MEGLFLLFGLFVFVLIILITRLLGAWMLRIDEVIKYQKEQIEKQDKILEILRESKTHHEIANVTLKMIANK